MDFPIAEPIQRVVRRLVDRSDLGYCEPPRSRRSAGDLRPADGRAARAGRWRRNGSGSGQRASGPRPFRDAGQRKGRGDRGPDADLPAVSRGCGRRRPPARRVAAPARSGPVRDGPRPVALRDRPGHAGVHALQPAQPERALVDPERTGGGGGTGDRTRPDRARRRDPQTKLVFPGPPAHGVRDPGPGGQERTVTITSATKSSISPGWNSRCSCSAARS